MTASACALASALRAAWATARASTKGGLPRAYPCVGGGDQERTSRALGAIVPGHHVRELGQCHKLNTECIGQPRSAIAVEHRRGRCALAKVLAAKQIDAISVVGGDALPVCPFGDRAIDLLLLGRTSRLSKVDEEGVIAADVGLDFATNLFGLRAAQPPR
jgi:hypothetical protein